MEDITLDKKISNSEVKDFLSNLFSDLEIFHYDFNDNSPKELDQENDKHIFFNTSFDQSKKEFAFVISIYRTPNENEIERQLYLSKKMSDYFGTRTIVPFKNPNEPDYPYYDIIFQNGTTFLSDDSNTSFADGSDGLVKIISEYKLPNYYFNNLAKLDEGPAANRR